MTTATATAPAATIRAGIYLRISNDGECACGERQDHRSHRRGEPDFHPFTKGRQGVSNQRKVCLELARRRGWQVIEPLYEDDDLSAFSGVQRPAYKRLMDDIEAGTINAVIAWHQDRLQRSLRDLEDFIDLINKTGCQVETVQSGAINLSTYDGRMMARILGSIARRESEHKSARQKLKHVQLAEEGKDGGGGRPFGFEGDRMSIRLDEAVLIREAVERVLAGEGIRGICRDWTARGIKTVKGGPWQPHVLQRMVTSARISGRRDVGTEPDGKRPLVGRDPVTAVWKPIITVEQSDRVRALLSDPGRRQGARRATHLLTGGLAVCGRQLPTCRSCGRFEHQHTDDSEHGFVDSGSLAVCGAALVSRPKANDRSGGGVPIPALTCATGPGYKGCGHLGILNEPLEELVLDKLLLAIDTGELAKAMRSTDDRKPVAALAKVDEKMADLARDWAADRLSRKEWHAAREPLEARKRDLQRQVDNGRRSVGLDGIDVARIRENWSKFPLHSQKAILGALVEAVVIGPGRRGYNKFDKKRVTIRWKV